MRAPPSTPAPDAVLPADHSAERLAMLRALAEIGMSVARAVGRRAEAIAAEAGEDTKDAPAKTDDLALAFARVSRAVRLTLALEARMEGEASETAREAARGQEIVRAAKEAGERARIADKLEKFEDIAKELIEAEAGADQDAAERLYEVLDERLDEIEVDELMGRPMAELVAAICRDLGIAPDWRDFEDEDWVQDAGGLEAIRLAWAKADAPAAIAEAASTPPPDNRPP